MGARHTRVRGERYDAFIDAFVRTVASRFPNALLHWEDLGASNARRILERYRSQVCTFNDDMQGTGAVVLGGVTAAARASRLPLAAQRVIIFGAGTAGIGIADLIRDAMVREGLSREQAVSRFWCLGRHGLLVDGMEFGMRDFQLSYARPAGEVRGWQRGGDSDAGAIRLLEVVRRVQPTLLIGCSTSPGAFTERSFGRWRHTREAHHLCDVESQFALRGDSIGSNRVDRGRALVATGGPFPPVAHEDTTYSLARPTMP